MKANRWVAGTLLVATLAGCATSRNSFYADPTAVGDGQICRTLAGENVSADAEFEHALRTELRMRGVSEADCSAIVQTENVAIGVGAVLGAVIVAAAANSDGGEHHHRHRRHGRETYIDIDIDVPPPIPAEVQWDWDQYENASGILVWGCRGISTRELVHPDKCNGKEMADYRWPAKTF